MVPQYPKGNPQIHTRCYRPDYLRGVPRCRHNSIRMGHTLRLHIPHHTPPPPSGSGKAATVTILGFANAHGTHYLLLFLSVLLSALLVQKPMGSGALSLMTLQILTLLEVLDSSSSELKESSIGPIILAMLGSYHFF